MINVCKDCFQSLLFLLPKGGVAEKSTMQDGVKTIIKKKRGIVNAEKK